MLMAPLAMMLGTPKSTLAVDTEADVAPRARGRDGDRSHACAQPVDPRARSLAASRRGATCPVGEGLLGDEDEKAPQEVAHLAHVDALGEVEALGEVHKVAHLAHVDTLGEVDHKGAHLALVIGGDIKHNVSSKRSAWPARGGPLVPGCPT